MRCLLVAVVACLAGAVLSDRASAQLTMDHPASMIVPYEADSGLVANPAFTARQVFADVVESPGAAWIRVYFGDVQLGPGGSIRVTSLLDNEVQELDAAGLAMWGNTTAYFNGDTVVVELIAGGKTRDNRLVVAALERPVEQVGDPGECGICNSDDRVPSSEEWASRLLPAGCTASVYNTDSCMVSAGHCIGGNMVVQFNVPDSDPNCSLNNPPIADQFPIVTSQQVNGGPGNDWAALIPGTNGQGQLPFDRFGAMRPIAASPVSVGALVQVWGYGVDNTCTRSQTQQTADGQVTSVSSAAYQFNVDIRGGNSGSSLIGNGQIIGIVTHCSGAGCPPGANTATRIDLPTFQAARDDLCGDTLLFSFPGELPEVVDPDGGTTVDVVVSADTGVPVPGTGLFFVSIDGGPFLATPMASSEANSYTATFPEVGCSTPVQYYFQAMSLSGSNSTSPDGAPSQSYSTVGGDSILVTFNDDFESDMGWAVTAAGGLTDGQWQRGVPIPLGTCDRGNPGTDADGSGQCYLTDNSSANGCNSDVDGGQTILTSPLLDASDSNAVISYWRWFSTEAGGNPFQDVMTIEVSDDGGASWTLLETVGPDAGQASGGWVQAQFVVGNVVDNTDEFRIRFIAEDDDPQSVVEAAVDGVSIVSIPCTECVWDLDNGGSVGTSDLLLLLSAWGQNPPGPPDFDGGGVGTSDLLILLSNWGGCP